MVFSKKWPKNHQKFLLHFLIHIDVLMLCSKFELILTSFFSSYSHFKKTSNICKIPKAIVHGFFQKMAKKSPKIFITFSDTY